MKGLGGGDIQNAYYDPNTGGNNAYKTIQLSTSTTDGGGYTIDTSPTGGDGAHNNLQPYITLNYIIKT